MFVANVRSDHVATQAVSSQSIFLSRYRIIVPRFVRKVPTYEQNATCACLSFLTDPDTLKRAYPDFCFLINDHHL